MNLSNTEICYALSSVKIRDIVSIHRTLHTGISIAREDNKIFVNAFLGEQINGIRKVY